MIISFRHNYIFFSTRQTASRTLETVLQESLDPDDVVTMRRLAAEPPRLLTGTGEPKVPLRGHMTAEEILPWLPAEFWERAFKFATERHPYEKAVSLAYFRWQKRDKVEAKHGEPLPADFSSYLDQVVRGGDYEGFPVYTINGRSVVDDFIRHETLDADLRRIGARLGVPIPAELPHKKEGYRTDPRPAREVLSDAQKEIVFARCRPEFELLDYER